MPDIRQQIFNAIRGFELDNENYQLYGRLKEVAKLIGAASGRRCTTEDTVKYSPSYLINRSKRC